jgi:2-polyprenyl-3-methyl-5-hydroxy-6-metoxy-1,4-benzoquinol methylase
MKRLFKRVRARLEPILQSDTAFIEAAYREILGRPADQDGLDHYRRVLSEGMGRSAILLSLARSDEFRRGMLKTSLALADLRPLRPDRFRVTVDRTNDEAITVFDAREPADFDWLERAILEHRYYEKPGVWNLGIDVDKRIIAEMIQAFAPQRALEIGCAAGAVLECLQQAGVHAEGVEISDMARNQASDAVRRRIHHGDLLALDLPADYDVVFGLDIFEHLNPNRLDSYLARIAQITRDHAYLFCNIPAFGDDPVFGTVFPLYVDGWQQDADAGRPFTALHVDEGGYPLHGHLIWADARWWVSRFDAAGFQRDVEIERAFQRKYGQYMEKRSPARRAFFVFGKQALPDSRAAILRRIAEPSAVLR